MGFSCYFTSWEVGREGHDADQTVFLCVLLLPVVVVVNDPGVAGSTRIDTSSHSTRQRELTGRSRSCQVMMQSLRSLCQEEDLLLLLEVGLIKSFIIFLLL